MNPQDLDLEIPTLNYEKVHSHIADHHNNLVTNSCARQLTPTAAKVQRACRKTQSFKDSCTSLKNVPICCWREQMLVFVETEMVCEIGSSFTLQWISPSKSRLTCEIPNGSLGQITTQRLPRITAMEFQIKNFPNGHRYVCARSIC